MTEYIKREAAMDMFGDAPMWQGYYEPYPWKVHCAIVGIVKLLKEEIGKIPAADVAPVVHCRHCRSYNKPRLGWCSVHLDREGPDDFCGYGVRMDGDESEAR